RAPMTARIRWSVRGRRRIAAVGRRQPEPASELEPEFLEGLDDDGLRREGDVVQVDEVSGEAGRQLERELALPAPLPTDRDLDPVGPDHPPQELALPADTHALGGHAERFLEHLRDGTRAVPFGQGPERLGSPVPSQKLTELHRVPYDARPARALSTT